MTTTTDLSLHLKPGNPDFLDLPWERPLIEWKQRCPRFEELPRGVSRHSVVFVNYDGDLFALKELPPTVAQREYDILTQMDEMRLPTVKPVGYALIKNPWGETSILITDYLDYSLPYRSLFIPSGLIRHQEYLLDAMAGLLVQLHLAGVFWGDCSLSNTLFRRDAGALCAYLVDAETTQLHQPLPPQLRHKDLTIMQENVTTDLADLAASKLLPSNYPIFDTGASIHQRYQRLWNEITREITLAPHERFRIHERLKALNALGFSVSEIELRSAADGEKLSLRAFVSDRNFHRDQLYSLTGIEAEEMQALKMVNEIHELQATLSQKLQHSVPLSVAAYHWLEHIYHPTIEQLMPLIQQGEAGAAELYCNVLEHKWYLSEKAQRDVGHQTAVQDFLRLFHTSLSNN